jgi:hypothetical protein
MTGYRAAGAAGLFEVETEIFFQMRMSETLGGVGASGGFGA